MRLLSLSRGVLRACCLSTNALAFASCHCSRSRSLSVGEIGGGVDDGGNEL